MCKYLNICLKSYIKYFGCQRVFAVSTRFLLEHNTYLIKLICVSRYVTQYVSHVNVEIPRILLPVIYIEQRLNLGCSG